MIMKSDISLGEFLVVFVILSTIIFIVIFTAIPKRVEQKEREAIEAGVAEYYLDKDNNRQFRYLPRQQFNERK